MNNTKKVKGYLAMKYDKMVAISQEKSKRKIEISKKQINDMLDRKERITVTALARYTGFSNTFFNRNPEVRAAVEEAKLQQGECYNPKKVIFDRAARETIIQLNIKIKTLAARNKELVEKNMILEQQIKELIDKSQA